MRASPSTVWHWAISDRARPQAQRIIEEYGLFPQMLRALADGLGAKWLPRVLHALIDGDREARVFSLAAGIAQENPLTARNIFQGQTIIEGNKGILPANSATFRTDTKGLRDALWRRPEMAAALLDTTLAYYAYSSNLAGDYSGTFDKDRFDDAVSQTVGSIVSYNGSPVVAPQRGMTQTDFDRLMASLDNDDLGEPIYARNGGRVTASDITRFGQLASIGDGRYEVRIGGYDVSDAQGRRYILDLRNVTPKPWAPSGFDNGLPLHP